MPKETDKLKREAEISDNIILASEFVKKDLPPSRWVVDKLIPEGITILSASPGAYKTFLALEMLKQISCGDSALFHFDCEKRNCLYINEEMGEGIMQDRLNIISANMDGLWISNMQGIKIEDNNMLLEFCKEKNISFVCFDSLTRIHSLQENNADDVKKIFEKLSLLTKNNISSLLIHHHRKSSQFTKGGSEEMRGSIDLLAQVDCHLAVSQISVNRDFIVLSQHKIRIAEPIPDIKIEINYDSDLEKIKLMYSGEFTKSDDWLEKIEAREAIVVDIIKNHPGATKEEISKMVDSSQINIRLLNSILPDLEKKQIIYSVSQKPKTYYLTDIDNGKLV